MKTLYFLLTIYFSLNSISFASGVITVRGKLVSMTTIHYVVETETMIYYIKRSEVTKAQTEALDRTEIEVSIPVSMESIERVKSKTNPH